MGGDSPRPYQGVLIRPFKGAADFFTILVSFGNPLADFSQTLANFWSLWVNLEFISVPYSML